MRAALKPIRRALSGLQLRTTLLLSCVVLAAVGLTATLCLTIAERLTMSGALRGARDLARSLAVASAADVQAGNRDRLAVIVQEIVPEGEIAYVVFADMSGRVLTAYQKGQGRVGRWMSDDGRSVSVEPIDRPTPVAQEHGGSLVDVVYPVMWSPDRLGHEPGDPQREPSRVTVGYVRLGVSLAAAEARMTDVMRGVIGLGIGITLLMVPLGFEVVRRVVAPLNRLAHAARRLATGQLDARANIERRDEIGDLSRAFDGMAADLSRSHNQLVTLNAELEDRVLRRTAELESAVGQLRSEISEKEDLMRMVSHDLSAPLRNVTGMAAALRRKQGTSLTADAAHCLDRIEHNIREELGLIDDLLELSRLQTARGVDGEVDLHAIVESLRRQLEFELAAKGIRLEVEGRLPTVYCDRRLMRQLLQNLIDNAVKYTDPKRLPPGRPPRISISCRKRPDAIEIRVSDDGIGVAPEDAERVFHVFRRSRDGFVSQVAGRGVGLSSCKSIVQKYGGRIWVEPKPGGGSVFCFTLKRELVTRGGDEARRGSTTKRRPAEAAARPRVEGGVKCL